MSFANDVMKKKSTSRSVNDYQSVDDLRQALRSMNEEGSAAVPRMDKTGVDVVHNVVDSSVKVAASAAIDAVGKDLGISQKLPLIRPAQRSRSRSEGHKRSESYVLGPIDDEEAVAKKAMETELRRLAVLKSYRVIGSGQNAAYERLVSLTSRIFKAPIVYVSVLDLAKQHLLAARGLGAMTSSENERDMSICPHLVDSDHDILVIPDLTADEQFKDHHNVKGVPHLRFFAGSPLICPEGYRLGTLCVLDTEPRLEGLSLDMKQNLREIADMVMDVMVEERERKNFEYRQPSQMIACTSNDLMTPLLGVVEGLSTIRDDEELLNSLSVQQKEVFNTAFACSSVMTRICKKSLESFQKKIKNNRAESCGEPVQEDKAQNLLNISELVQHLHVIMNPFPKRVPLVVTTFDEVPNVIVADDLKVFRSIVNFLTNACGNTETGSVHLKIFLKEESEDDDVSDDTADHQSIVFMVEDTGNGISVDQYQYLFKPVVTETDEKDTSCTLASFGDSTVRTKKTGLGLYSVATQIGSIGGNYGFRPRGFSESGSQLYDENGNVLKGSIFWFSIPLVVPDGIHDPKSSVSKAPVTIVDSDDEDADTTHDKRKWNADDEAALDEDFSHSVSVGSGEKRSFKAFVGEPSGARQKRALVIDDSLVTRRNMSRMLKKMGFEVVEAVNGMEGLRELQANLYDLVLCDFLMPVMDGSDCIQQYRQFEVASRPWFDQYIVGMSAHASEGDVERGLKVGMNDYCEKPVTMKHLEEILQGQEYNYVTTRLDSIAADIRDSDDDTAKQPKKGSDISDDASPQSEQVLKVCLIVEEGDAISSVAGHVAEQIGWKSVVVHNGQSALRLLQMRNWDAVLVDDGLQGLTSCMVMEHFREWESKNRVNRQKNVYQLNSSFIPSHLAMSSMVQLPSGFDGALGKPVSAKVFKEFLQKSVDGKNCMSHDIVRR
jgi:CheY-like chemotaxis protein